MTFNVVPGIQIVGEAGRIGNVLPTLANSVFSLAQTDLRASVFYGEGGVRFVVAPGAAVTLYAEATGGVARLDVSSARLGTVASAVTSIALGLAGRTTPIAGGGTGSGAYVITRMDGQRFGRVMIALRRCAARARQLEVLERVCGCASIARRRPTTNYSVRRSSLLVARCGSIRTARPMLMSSSSGSDRP